MDDLSAEADAFRGRKAQQVAAARQRVALQLACGFDIDHVADMSPVERRALLDRIERAIERERTEGRASPLEL